MSHVSVVPEDAGPDELVDEIEQIRQRLGANIDEIIYRTNPKNVVARQLERTKAHFVTPDGSPRIENIVPVVTIAVGAIAALVLVRRLLR